MARDGLGTYSRVGASAVAGTVATAAYYNAEINDLATALTASVAKDGQTTPTANLPMGGFKHTNIAVATARTDYAAMAQIQDGSVIWCSTAGGSGNAITLAPSPAITAYVAGQVFRFIASAGNTAATTLAVSDLTTKAVQSGLAALASGDIDTGKTYEAIYDGTAFQIRDAALAGAGGGAGAGSATTTAEGLVELATTSEAKTGTDTTRAIVATGLAAIAGGQWADVASATGPDIGANASSKLRITGTTTITSFVSATSGVTRFLRFAGILTFTHNATTLILPNAGSNITTAAGDTAIAVSLGSGNWIVTQYQRADGTALQSGAAGEANTSSNAGLGAQLAKTKVALDLPFRTLSAPTLTNSTVGSGAFLINATLSAASWVTNTNDLQLSITLERTFGPIDTGGS